MADKPPSKPAWYKNTYFWIAAILALLGFIGLIQGQEAIRDPGQRRETGINLAYLYFGAAILMLVNGLVSHSQTVQHYREVVGDDKSDDSVQQLR